MERNGVSNVEEWPDVRELLRQADDRRAIRNEVSAPGSMTRMQTESLLRYASQMSSPLHSPVS